MPDYKEVLHERLYVRVPGTDKLRKTAAARIKHLLANGWRETERDQRPDHVMVRFERTGHAPMRARLPKAVPEVKFERRPPRPGPRWSGRARRSRTPLGTSPHLRTEGSSVFGAFLRMTSGYHGYRTRSVRSAVAR